MSPPLHALIAIALVSANAIPAMAAQSGDAYTLEFSARPFDTRYGAPTSSGHFPAAAPDSAGLRLIQFGGPIEQVWLDTLSAHGIEPLQYLPTNGYLVWTDNTEAVTRLAGFHARQGWLTFHAPFHAELKLDPLLDRRVNAATGEATDEVDIVVQIHSHPGDRQTRQLIESLALLATEQQGPVGAGRRTTGWSAVRRFANLDLRVRIGDIPLIAAQPDVSFIGERLPSRLYDEKQTLIMSGDMLPGASSHSHLQFLIDRGFPTDPHAYPIVDITDSTIQEGGTGTGVTNTQDPTLRTAGDPAQPSRVMYFENCSDRPAGQVGAEDGHGTINASIVAGYDQRNGWPYQDDEGQYLGLGVNPFGRVGSTTVFVGAAPSFNNWGCGGTDQGIIAANVRNGAAISSNSWGSASTGTYTPRDQAYDAAVRNADPESTIEQAIIYLIAAGNHGPSADTVGSPATAKNVIAIGASENLRPVDIASQCPGDSLASVSDDPQSIARFSSRGPVAGSRIKPELVAPGTRITGSRSLYPGFAGGGVCIPDFPNGQSMFSASSGTSHSTPAVSGAASLAYWWIENGGGVHADGTLDMVGGARAPSPALMKAWLIAHPTYLTGVDGGGNLPSPHQGYGMPNLSNMFDATPKVLVDQTDILDASGDLFDYTWGIDDHHAPVRIVLVWTDAPGQPGASPQVNNLDLEVVAGGTTYLGNRFLGEWSTPGGFADARNNYEAVFLPAGHAGDITIKVRGTIIAGDGVPSAGDGTDQDFALVCVNCQRTPTFTWTLDQPALQACSGGSGSTGLHLEPLIGFDQPVTLSLAGLPTGVTAHVDPNNVEPPSHSILRLDAQPGTPAGSWPATLSGTAALASRTMAVSVDIYDAIPDRPTNPFPEDGSSDVPAAPTFAWEPVNEAHTYLVQIATDSQFTHIVRSHETRSTAWALPHNDALATSARYWWRVIARNACGDSDNTAGDTLFANGFEPPSIIVSQSFTTVVLPGDCPVDVAPVVVFQDDMENGAAGWTHGAGSGHTSLWSLTNGLPHSGNQAWQATAPASGAGNDAWLVSPPITLPSSLGSPTLSFWNQQSLKSGGGGVCYDGAIVEVSTNGSSWTALPVSITDPFDGQVNATFGNPLAHQHAWCGDPQPYLKSVIGLDNLSGQTVRFRFRLGHDRFVHRSGINWAIDDVRVAGCSP